MSDIAFALNYTNLFMIDITPDEATPTWARGSGGNNSAVPEGNEVSANEPY